MLFLYLIITFSLAIPATILVHLHVCQTIFMCPPCSDTFSLQWMRHMKIVDKWFASTDVGADTPNVYFGNHDS